MQICCKQDAWVCLLALSHDPECSSDKGLEAHHTECLAEHHEIIEDSTRFNIVQDLSCHQMRKSSSVTRGQPLLIPRAARRSP